MPLVSLDKPQQNRLIRWDDVSRTEDTLNVMPLPFIFLALLVSARLVLIAPS